MAANRRRARAIVVGFLSGLMALLMVLTATPASASTFYGRWYVPSGSPGGYYAFLQPGAQYPMHNHIDVSDYRDGYNVRVRFQLQISGTWYTYYDRNHGDGYSGYTKIYPYPGFYKARFILCPKTSGWGPAGSCQYHYGTSSN